MCTYHDKILPIIMTVSTIIIVLSSSSVRCHAFRSAWRTTRTRATSLLHPNSFSLYANYHTSTSLAAGRRPRGTDSTANTDTALNWANFEYSHSPKWDHRFHAADEIIVLGDTDSSKEEALRNLYKQETAHDAAYAAHVNQQSAAWQTINAATVQRATDLVRPYINDERVQRIQTVLRQRTGNTRFLFESE
jgi:hypothetical protein